MIGVLYNVLHSQALADACLAVCINITLPRALQEDEKREDDFSRAMVATDDLACAHPASGQVKHRILTSLQ